jgi:hypothetical protein
VAQAFRSASTRLQSAKPAGQGPAGGGSGGLEGRLRQCGVHFHGCELFIWKHLPSKKQVGRACLGQSGQLTVQHPGFCTLCGGKDGLECTLHALSLACLGRLSGMQRAPGAVAVCPAAAELGLTEIVACRFTRAALCKQRQQRSSYLGLCAGRKEGLEAWQGQGSS